MFSRRSLFQMFGLGSVAAMGEARPLAAADVKREVLTAARTYFVRTDGNDSNTGLTNTAAGAFLTLQGAYDALMRTIDTAGYTVTISVQDGTYFGTTTIGSRLVGQANTGSFLVTGGSGAILDGNSSDPTLSILSCGATFQIDGGITVRNSGSGHGIRIADSAYGEIWNVTFGACGDYHIVSAEAAQVYVAANYSITGGARGHINVQGNANLEMYDLSVTLTGTPAFTQFVEVAGGGCVQSSGNTYTGACTGFRFCVYDDGVIENFGSGFNYFPGSKAGTATGGRYDDILYSTLAGGTDTDSVLILGSTSGAGTTDAIVFQTGSQVEQLRIDTNGNWTSPYVQLEGSFGFDFSPANDQSLDLGTSSKRWRNGYFGSPIIIGAASGVAPATMLDVRGGAIASAPPAIKTTNYSQVATDSSLIFNGAGTITLTLEAASTCPGRWIHVKTIAAQAVNSASANVKPIGSDTAGTAILPATAGKWATLQSDGTNWIIMAAN